MCAFVISEITKHLRCGKRVRCLGFIDVGNLFGGLRSSVVQRGNNGNERYLGRQSCKIVLFITQVSGSAYVHLN